MEVFKEVGTLMSIENIIDLITNSDVIDMDAEDFFFKDKNSYSSIADQASNLTATFPILISSCISLKTAEKISKALEFKYAMMLQMVIASRTFTTSNDVIDFLKKFHNNIDESCILKNKEDKIVFEMRAKKIIEESFKQECILKAEKENIKFNAFNDNKKMQSFKEAKSMEDILNKNSVKRPQLNDQRVKKANALNPLTITVPIKVKAADNAVINVDAILGVKTKLYPVNSGELTDKICSTRENKINLFNFIRAFSGEIKFWRDFIFALKTAKIDANFNAKKAGSKLWKVLEHRSKKSKIFQKLNINNLMMSISTLVLTLDEADYLSKVHNIDLTKSDVARQFLSNLNLISLMIVDESLETVRTIMDTGNDEWEYNTFKAFNRDEELDYKQLVKMMSKTY